MDENLHASIYWPTMCPTRWMGQSRGKPMTSLLPSVLSHLSCCMKKVWAITLGSGCERCEDCAKNSRLFSIYRLGRWFPELNQDAIEEKGSTVSNYDKRWLYQISQASDLANRVESTSEPNDIFFSWRFSLQTIIIFLFYWQGAFPSKFWVVLIA
jgi:hypothetical protein